MIEYIFFNFILIKLIIKNIFIMLLSEVFFFIKKNGNNILILLIVIIFLFNLLAIKCIFHLISKIKLKKILKFLSNIYLFLKN